MHATFIEAGDLKLAIEFSAETDEERLLLRAFDKQIGGSIGVLNVNGWATGIEPGYRKLRVEQSAPRTVDAEGTDRVRPSPSVVALHENFVVEFAITPATARSMVTEGDALILSPDELSEGGDTPKRLRVLIHGTDTKAYLLGENEIGEPTWFDLDVQAPKKHFHGLYLASHVVIAIAYRFLTLTRRNANATILSIGEF